MYYFVHRRYEEARTWVERSLDLTQNKDVNLFECTIRVLGGLLSTHALTKDPLFKTKAIDLGDRLMYAFKSPSKVFLQPCKTTR